MTNKRVEWARKVGDKMRTRGFGRADVRWLLERGLPVPTVTLRGETRFAKQGYVRGREAKVVYLENDERILVISPQWILSKGELARQKARPKRNEED